MTELPLPTFLIVGAQKSATRWLRRNLGRHPSVFTAERELEFFNHHFDEGPDWYRACFEGWAGEPFVGEATPGYMFPREDPERQAGRVLDVLGPDVRILAVLREPVARTRSAYVHHLRRGRIDPALDPREMLADLDPIDDPLGLISGSWYAAGLEPYLRRFGGGVHVAFHDDVAATPAAVYQDALRHVGVDDDWTPADLHEARDVGSDQLAAALPDYDTSALADERIRDVIAHHFTTDLDRLEAMLGRAVPWRRDAPTGEVR